jgi:hypothetical protein
MKNFKGFTLGLVLGLSIAIGGLAFAQSNMQTDPNKKSECCCMAMKCCEGDSCPMMKDGAKKEGATKSDGHGCCCCGGESCEMNHSKHMKDKTKP